MEGQESTLPGRRSTKGGTTERKQTIEKTRAINKSINLPVVIVGGGPAGAATAIALRRQQIPCVVLEAGASAGRKPGESIPPNARVTLKELGIVHLLEDAQHQRCTGNTVVWGDDHPHDRFFFTETMGDGWHINRAFFEQQLSQTAKSMGAYWLHDHHFTNWEQQEDHLLIHCSFGQGSSISIKAAFAVDASGRTAALARKAGATRQSLDRLTGYYAIVPAPLTALPSTTFIEATANGWWYAAALHDNHTVINFMTDADIHPIDNQPLVDWLFQQFRQTAHLQQCLPLSAGTDLQQVMAKPASTSFLTTPAGPHWLAVGDAACTYDPLTSYGITAALGSGLYAALAITDHLNGKELAKEAYCYIQQTTFNKCLAMLQHQYGLEKRWMERPFWQRRRAIQIKNEPRIIV
ncbi:tryptophan 7-halogenase [Paraflavitalea soli]|uniref:tryptophan 7-halogenase n=1 Tax=Paraflavitalea soli TaxID=2315862 RepID=UPI002938D0EA|nr:tryptophan 7-halogenase [Paraflavitalea soli]